MLGELIYEARGEVTNIRVIKLKPVKFEGTYIAEGTMNDIKIKEYCTFISTRKSKSKVYGEGKHTIITENNDTVVWIGRGFGKNVGNKQIWRGSGIFTSEDIERYNNIIGIVEAEIIDNKLEIKVWEWE